MILTFVSLLFSLFVISLLIFVHELGHYIMAKRVGMRVEVFSIGIGSAIYSWNRGTERWQICIIPFGGYVKVVGREDDSSSAADQDPQSYFAKHPKDRIKMALAGPMANLLLSLVLFSALYLLGGRFKNFSDYTSRIGWLDHSSLLYSRGVRDGDYILSYDGVPFEKKSDHLLLTNGEQVEVKGIHCESPSKCEQPFDLWVPSYPHPDYGGEVATAGVIYPASFLYYEPNLSPSVDGLAKGSPLLHSGIELGDRLIWADGEFIYSQPQLSHQINESSALLTIERGGKHLLRRVPTSPLRDLRLPSSDREEIKDLYHEELKTALSFEKIAMIPYAFDAKLTIQKVIPKIHQESLDEEQLLQKGDRIVAIHGIPVNDGASLLREMQNPKLLLIVEKNAYQPQPTDLAMAEEQFTSLPWDELHHLISQIGIQPPPLQTAHFKLLQPVEPKPHYQFAVDSATLQALNQQYAELRHSIEAIEDEESRKEKLLLLDRLWEKKFLGPPYFIDRKIRYNPPPLQLFWRDSFSLWRSLSALVTGRVGAENFAGPVGIIQLIQKSWQESFRDGIYWLSFLSLNLGILNLLPLPVLDGGHILFALYEWVSGRKLSPKAMEMMIVPFVVLLLGFFLFITYHDLLRLFSSLFG